MSSTQSKNSVVKRCIFSTLAVFWMIVIFMFSARDGNTSSQDSYEVGLLVGQMTQKNFASWTEEEQLMFAKKIDHPVRKIAHATEYALLGMLLLGALGREKKQLFFAWSIATFYAMTDEIHQVFVPGRACHITDVLIDSGGAFVGIMIAIAMCKCVMVLGKEKD